MSYFGRFAVLTTVKSEFLVFWNFAPCSVVIGYQRFGEMCWRFNPEDWGITFFQNVDILPPHYTAQKIYKLGGREAS